MRKKNSKFGGIVGILIALLGFSGAVLAFAAVTESPLLTAISYAKDGEDSSGSGSGSSNEEDQQDTQQSEADKKAKEVAKEREKVAKEAAKKRAEFQRELLKKKAELLQEQAKKREELKKEDMGDLEKEEKKADKEEEKKAEIIKDINEEIIDAEERIAEAQAEGIDVTKANATLAAAKAKAQAAEASLATISYEALRNIEKEVKKLAHFASHKDVKSARDIQKDVDKISKRLSQTTGKLSLYQSLGGNPDEFSVTLLGLEEEFTALKTKLTQGGEAQIEAIESLEPLERKVKNLKSSIEGAIYALGGTDERFDDDYENETEDIYDDLHDVAEIEGEEVGAEIEKIAMEQKKAAGTVGKSVAALDKRNRVLQFLFGASTGHIKRLEAEIEANKTRISDLTTIASTIDDPEVKAITEEQIKSLERETSKLETFVSAQKNRPSTLGWFFNLF